MYLLYLTGPPAAGKSTLVSALTQDLRRVPSEGTDRVPFDKLYRDREIVGAELGRRRDGFPGTDTLQMNVMPRARQWIQSHFYPVVIAEGSRLASMRFLDSAAEAGYEVHLAVMNARMSVLDERCSKRGSTQSRSYRLGRATMSLRLGVFAEEAGYHVHNLDAERPVAELKAELMKLPALKVLKGSDGPVPAHQ